VVIVVIALMRCMHYWMRNHQVEMPTHVPQKIKRREFERRNSNAHPNSDLHILIHALRCSTAATLV